MVRHARSFTFAAAFMSPGERRAVEGIYAFCRATDDLVDDPPAGAPAATVLDVWERLSRAAFRGVPSRLPVIDRAMELAAGEGVPWPWIRGLFEGMRMDLRGTPYATLEDLRVYAHRVAGVVGLWLAWAYGVRDEETLRRADALGRAMQLTNIVRDVGEDLRVGRLYLPRRLLAREGVTVADLLAGLAGSTPPAGYPAVLEGVMAEAERDYGFGLAGVRALPAGFGRAAAVAARVYRGIHDEIRRNGYDNLTRRNATSLPRKVVLALGALAPLAASS